MALWLSHCCCCDCCLCAITDVINVPPLLVMLPLVVKGPLLLFAVTENVIYFACGR